MFTNINQYATYYAFVAAGLITTLLMFGFLLAEPKVMIAQEFTTDEFTVRQQITGEIAFVTTAQDVVMADPIGGQTGGTSQGTTTVAVRTNNPTGYVMTIEFASTTAMLGETQGGYIANYAPATPGTPDQNFIVPTGTHGFAYSVNTEDADDIEQLFQVSTGNCNEAAGTQVAGECWYGTANAETPVQIVDRPDATPGSGATTTIAFRVGVDANPSPTLPTDFYTATATLTATED